MTPLTAMRNLGATSAAWLESVGIASAEQLEDVGALEAYRRVKAAYPQQVTLNMLYALQGAILGIPWDQMPLDMRDDLKQQANEIR